MKYQLQQDNTDFPSKSRFGKESIFYVAQEGTLRDFLTQRGLYEKAKANFQGIDLETIVINHGVSSKVPDKLKKL